MQAGDLVRIPVVEDRWGRRLSGYVGKIAAVIGPDALVHLPEEKATALVPLNSLIMLRKAAVTA